MRIDDTIQTLVKVRRSIDTWVPQRTTRPDALIADLNDLYVGSTGNRDFDELFEYIDYLDEVKASANENAGTSETE